MLTCTSNGVIRQCCRVKFRLNHLKQDRQSSPERTTFCKFYSTEYEIELLLQTEFEFIKVQQSLSVAEKINDSLATKPDIMMKPIHDVIHILKSAT